MRKPPRNGFNGSNGLQANYTTGVSAEQQVYSNVNSVIKKKAKKDMQGMPRSSRTKKNNNFRTLSYKNYSNYDISNISN